MTQPVRATGQPPLDEGQPVFVISVAAELTGLHAQTLRTYDRLGLVSPQRTPAGGRLYSVRDLARLREVARLSAEGVTLEGVRRILDLQDEVDQLVADLERLRRRLADAEADRPRADLVLWRPQRP